MDYGRPRRVELMVLVDREGRELPIQADYVLRRVEIADDERIDVLGAGSHIRAVVATKGAPSTPPEAP
jgi:pyrimidine operon attenuation protein/uracil phosphoribosyltransferase